MARRGAGPEVSLAEARAALAARLRERRDELEAAVATRIYAIDDPREVNDPGYLRGLHAALVATVEYALTAIEVGERRAPDPPSILLAQVRLARNGVALDTVLRRCLVGNALLDEDLLASRATLFDRLLAVVSDEHGREAAERPTGLAARRRECVKQLLAGRMRGQPSLRSAPLSGVAPVPRCL
jgi:hypothetical protein